MNLFEAGANWLEGHTLSCPFRMLTGCDCPGCGLQRSFLHFLKGDVKASLVAHPAGIPLLMLAVFIALNFWIKWKHGNRLISWWLISIVLISLFNYGLKIYGGSCCF